MHEGRPLAVYVDIPLVDAAAFNACQPEFYQGNQAHAYIWHQGYFWYPHAHGGLLAGYKAHHAHGSYWYPSRVHPHSFYIDQQTMIPHEIYPVQMGSGEEGMMHKHRHHHGKHHGHHHHKGHMKHSAKEMPMEKGMDQGMMQPRQGMQPGQGKMQPGQGMQPEQGMQPAQK